MKGYIYSLDEMKNVFYIGSSTWPELRARAHKTQSRYFDEITRNWVTFFTLDFKMQIVDEIEYKWRQELEELEEYWIHQFIQWGFKIRNQSFNRNITYCRVPYDIRYLLKEINPKINPYRTVESDHFVNALYKIIRNYKQENEHLKSLINPLLQNRK